MDTASLLREEPVGAGPSLEPVAIAALDAGRLLMESGASARSVEAIVERIARGLGAERVDLRIGYASISVTVGVGDFGVTRMCKTGPLGVNQQLDQGLWDLAGRISRGELTARQSRDALTRLPLETPRHARWLTAIGVGLACAAFGRLLGVDWQGSGPVFLAASAGQFVRSKLLHYRVNAFLCAALVSFLSSTLSGLLAWWAQSATITTAVIASVLLLVPGVPAVNAQTDILDGRPTLGSARAVTVAMLLVFLAAGLWVTRMLLTWWRIL